MTNNYDKNMIRYYNQSAHGKNGPSITVFKPAIAPIVNKFLNFTYTGYPPEFNYQLRTIIKTRDLFVCQLCGYKQPPKGMNLDPDKYLQVHHINYNRMDCSHSNLITLCKRCHRITNSTRHNWYTRLTRLMIKKGVTHDKTVL